MKVVILCGGKGTRLREETEYKPKPLVLIGGKPILWHVMKIYSHYGYNDFILCLGYKGEMIKDYFLRLRESVNDFTLDFSSSEPKIIIHNKNHENWKITFTETGLETMTGGRVARIKKYITDEDFFLTYGDGVADIDIKKLYEFHKSQGKVATVTGVHECTFHGCLEVNGNNGIVKKYEEKPILKKDWVNGGFFVCNKKIFNYLSPNESCVFEKQPLEDLTRDEQLAIYKHDGFWYAMNTYKEMSELNKMWESGNPGWKIWSDEKECHPEPWPVARTGLVSGSQDFSKNVIPAKAGIRMTSENYWQNKNVFVTGCTGLLGSWLVKYLVDKEANVTGLMRDFVPQSNLYRNKYFNKINIVRGYLENGRLLERALGEYEIDTVFHLGAQTIVGIANRNPLSTFESNIRGTYNLLEACRRSPLVKKIVVASSDKAYGDQEQLPYLEDAPLQGRHPYDVSKSCVDLLCQAYFKSYNLPACITRCGNFFGGGDLNFNRVVPGTIRSILHNQAPLIRSDGMYIRDYIYIEDAVEAYLLLAQKMDELKIQGEAFNFSNENQMSVLELVKKIIFLMNSSLTPQILNQASNEIRHQYLSAKKAKEILGWQSKYSLKEGLIKTIEWYRKFFNQQVNNINQQ